MEMRKKLKATQEFARNLVIEMAEKDQLITELSQELEAYKKIVYKWRLQDESKMQRT